MKQTFFGFKSRLLTRATILAMLLVLATAGIVVPIVRADSYDDQIKKLENQNTQNKAAANDLQSQANGYQDAINRLQAEINTVQAQLDASRAEQVRLEQEIVAKQAELDRQRGLLSEDVKAMYVDGQMSAIEMLATSKNLSDYVDKEEYRNAIQQKIQEALTKIVKLQGELKAQKEKVDQLIDNQKSQQAQLSASRQQQADMLAYTQAQKNQFDASTKANDTRIAELRAEQDRENIRRFGSSAGMIGGGGYPWGNAPCIHTGKVGGSCSNYDWAVGGSIWNPATGGYGYRNCTDWVAWRGGAPAGLGNANTWATRGGAMGYPVSSTPRAGDAAVSEAGTYGHVMYVESVNGNTVTVSDYNRSGDGLYRVTNLTRVGEGLYASPNGVNSYLRFVSF